MKKGRLFKGLVLAMALVMLFSMTAFASHQTVTFATDGGATATGSVGFTSATTSVSSPMYVYAELEFKYAATDGSYKVFWRDASNSGTHITAYGSTPSDYDWHINSIGTHTAGSATAGTSYYD